MTKPPTGPSTTPTTLPTGAFPSLESIGIRPARSGKVRETLDYGDHLLLVTTDRLSAFDCILPTLFPGKGRILNQLSAFWLRGCGEFLPTHFVSVDDAALPAELRPHAEALAGRWMLVRKAERVSVECVVRGSLAGSGWKEYRETGTLWGELLPPGLPPFGELPTPLFTPTTKEETGHDRPIPRADLASVVGTDLARALEEQSLSIFTQARSYARARGLVLADTKFEFGWIDGRLSLIDEALTPDSSRYWTVESVERAKAGEGRPLSLDKQYVRDHLLSLDWDQTPPAPALPEEIVVEAMRRYRLAADTLTAGATRPTWASFEETR